MTSPNSWQRRYVLKHYRHWDDAALAHGAGLSVSSVHSFLITQGAVRSASDLRRIAQATGRPPVMWTPARLRERLVAPRWRALQRRDVLLVAAMFLASLMLYAVTAARTVTGEDSGELLAAAHGFGVPHPPGYPLWLVLAWAFDHAVPFGTVAWRVSMVSALFSAAANALLLVIALKTLRHRSAAFVAAALFAVSRTHWTQAVIPEVYGLNTFFVAAQIVLLMRLAEGGPSAPGIILLAFVTGLALTNHTSAVPVAGVVAVAALVIAPGLFRRPAVLGGALLAGLAPLLLYLVLPLASAREPYIDWGNPESASSLWAHVSRSQYASVESAAQHSDTLAERLDRMAILGDWAARQFGGAWVLLLALIGLFALAPRLPGLWLVMVLLAWMHSILITRYTAFSFDREHVYANQIFWIPAWLSLSWMIGGAVDAVFDRLALWRGAFGTAVGWVSRGGVAALVLVTGIDHARIADRSETMLIERYGRAMLAAMEPGTLFFPSSDHSTFSVMYCQGVLGERPDIVIADKYGMIDERFLESVMTDEDRAKLAGTPGSEQRRVRENILLDRWPGPVAFANKRDTSDLGGRTLQPCGPLFRLMTEDQAATWWTETDGLTPGLQPWVDNNPLTDLQRSEATDFTVQMVAGDLRYMQGFALLAAGRLEDAMGVWQGISGDLAPLKQLFNNIGSALAERGRSEQALVFYERALEEDASYVLGWRNLALVHKERGEASAAIRCLTRVVEIDPAQKGARLHLAHLLDDAQRPVEALAQYEELAKADRDDAVPWREAGQLLHRLGDVTKAESAYREALRINRHDDEVALWLDRLRRGMPLRDEFPDPLAEVDDLPGAFGPQIPGLPADPSLRLAFDPLRGR